VRLRRLEVRRIASYEDAEIDFESLEYPVFVTGPTGAGKTTLFIDALTTALYKGAYGSEREFTDLVMKPHREGHISLEFSVGDELYKIDRVLSSRGGKATLRKFDPKNNRWVPISSSISAIDSEIKRITSLDYNGLLNSAVIRQGEVYDFLNMKSSDRRALLLRLMNLRFEKFKEKAYEKFRDVGEEISKLEGRLEERERRISKEESVRAELRDVEQKIPQLKREKNKKDKERKELSSSLMELREKAAVLEEELKATNIEDLKKELQKKRAEYNNLNEEIRRVEEDSKRFNAKLLSDVHKYARLVHDLKLWLSRLENLNGENGEISNLEKLMMKKREISEIKSKLEEYSGIDREISRLKNLLEENNKKIGELEAKLNEAEKLRSEVIKLDEEHPPSCPLCGSPLKGEQLKKHLQNLSDEMVKYRGLLKSLLAKKKELSAKIENFEKRRAKKHRLESQLQLYVSELRSFPNLEKKLEECHAEAERLKKRIEDSRLSLLNVTNTTSLEDAERAVEEAVKIAEEMKSLPSKRELKNKIDKEIKELEKKLGNLPQLTSKLEELHKRVKEKEERLRVVESTLQNLLQTLGNLQNKKSSLEKELSEIMVLKEEAEKLRKSLEELKLDHEAYHLLYSKVFHPGGLPTHLLSEVVNLMEEYVNRYLRLFGVDVKMKFKLNVSGNQQRIDILTYSGGYQRRIETFSGGEQTLMGLAVRLSIGRLLAEVYSTRQRPQFLIIDEGFGPLDRDLRERVVDALKKLYEAGEYSQIVVISHHEDVKNHPAFRTIIRISKDADGRSHVTIL